MPTTDPAAPTDADVPSAGATDPTTADNGATEGEELKLPVPDAPEMRAVVLTAFGGINRVKVMKRAVPTPEEGEVLIRVKAW